jgi:hypothetical protein
LSGRKVIDSEAALEPRSGHDLPGTFRVNAYAERRRRRRKRRRRRRWRRSRRRSRRRRRRRRIFAVG